MSITKSTYSSSHSFSPRYLRIEQDSVTGIIIIDDVNVSGQVEVHTEIDRQEIWLKIVTGFGCTTLDEAPENITALDPAYENLDRMRLFAQSSEVLVVTYASTSKSTQEEVAGYQMQSSDILFVKIDRQTGTVTLYEEE